MASLNKTSKSWGVAFFAVVTVLAIFHFNKSLNIPDILSIQFTDNWQHFKEAVSGYSLERLNKNAYLDFVFMFLYSVLFVLSIKVMAQSMGFKVHKLFYLLCIIPGAFDLVENFSFLHFVNDLDIERNFIFYYWSVRIKWFFVIAFFLINLTIVFYYGLFIIGKAYNFFFGKSNGKNR